ncbi:MAG: RNA polymerase sporulation sigma factor SigK [Clostridia bacterium]|nr:RNA polymerase sporulation sigma factor SigK [Clostridia bacterium]
MFLALFSFLTRVFHMILGISTPQKFPPPMKKEEEEAAFLRMRAGDEEAREKLILHNLRLVSHIVRKYYAASADQEDLISIGTVGLVKAVDRFNEERGSKFATYAARCIQNEILMHFRAQKKHTSDVSINETIDVDRDGNPLSYMDVICTEEDFAEEVQRKILTTSMLRSLETVLSSRERQIVKLRYGLSGGEAKTQKEVADLLGISRSYVSRIEKSALQKLKDALS